MTHKQIRHYRIPLHRYNGELRGKPKSLLRYFRGNGFCAREAGGIPASRGGMTICVILNDEGEKLATGLSKCSYADNFNYKTGRDIAVGRAEKELAHAQTKGEK